MINETKYNEIYYKISRLKEIVQEYRQTEYHGKHKNVLYMKREIIRYYCDEIKEIFSEEKCNTPLINIPLVERGK